MVGERNCARRAGNCARDVWKGAKGKQSVGPDERDLGVNELVECVNRCVEGLCRRRGLCDVTVGGGGTSATPRGA